MTPLIISGHHTGTRQQHSRSKRAEAGAPQWVSPVSCVQCSRDQCPGQLRIDVSAATE